MDRKIIKEIDKKVPKTMGITTKQSNK